MRKTGEITVFTSTQLVGTDIYDSLDQIMPDDGITSSVATVTSDWMMEDGEARHYNPYTHFEYSSLTPVEIETITIKCPNLTVTRLMGYLEERRLKDEHLITFGIFIPDLKNKLVWGHDFLALGYNIESKTFAFTAQNILGNLPCFNLQLLAYTLYDTLKDYLTIEMSMTNILRASPAKILVVLNEMFSLPLEYYAS